MAATSESKTTTQRATKTAAEAITARDNGKDNSRSDKNKSGSNNNSR